MECQGDETHGQAAGSFWIKARYASFMQNNSGSMLCDPYPLLQEIRALPEQLKAK